MSKKLHPDAKLRHLVDAMTDHAHKHGVEVHLRLRWKDGTRVELKSDGFSRRKKDNGEGGE